MAKQWVAGWNMPGYMPETEAALFDDWGDACRYLSEELSRYADEEAEAENWETAEQAEHAARLLEEEAEPRKPVTVQAGSYVWWMEESV